MSNIQHIAQRGEIRQHLLKTIMMNEKTHPLLEVLTSLGLPKALIARHLGINRSTLNAYVGGKRSLPAKHLNALYRLLEESVDVASKIKISTNNHLARIRLRFAKSNSINAEERRNAIISQNYKAFLKNVNRAIELLKQRPTSPQ